MNDEKLEALIDSLIYEGCIDIIKFIIVLGFKQKLVATKAQLK